MKSGRRTIKANPLRADRIKRLINECHITQAKLAEELQMPPESLSRILKSQKISEELIRSISHTFPEYREKWLLGYDNIPTYAEEAALGDMNAVGTVLDAAIREVCTEEGMEPPPLDNLDDMLFLEARLRDYAKALIRDYIVHHDKSYTWKYLDKNVHGGTPPAWLNRKEDEDAAPARSFPGQYPARIRRALYQEQEEDDG